MGPEFTQVIRPLDTREAGEEKHISFLNGVFNTSEEKEEEEKPKKKTSLIFYILQPILSPLMVLPYIIMSARKVRGSKATGAASSSKTCTVNS